MANDRGDGTSDGVVPQRTEADEVRAVVVRGGKMGGGGKMFQRLLCSSCRREHAVTASGITFAHGYREIKGVKAKTIYGKKCQRLFPCDGSHMPALTPMELVPGWAPEAVGQ